MSSPLAAKSVDTRIRICPLVKEARILFLVFWKDFDVDLEFVSPDAAGDLVNVLIKGAREGSRIPRRRDRR